MINKIIKFLGREKYIISIFLVALLMRLLFLSPWLEDWDSVQFALALHTYSLTDHQPHPPGYPLYVMLGKLFYFFFRDDTQALTRLSALLGSLSTIPLYLLTKKMFNKQVAAISALLFILIPVSWVLSEAALTNVPGLFFLLAVIYLMYIFGGRARSLVAISFLGGIVLGVRFTELPIIVTLLAFLLLRRRKFKALLPTFLSFAAGVLTWMIPLAAITGPEEFLSSYGWIANYIIRHDALTGTGSAVSVDLLISRLGSLWKLLSTGYTKYFLLLSFFSLFIIFLQKGWREKLRYQFIIVWLLSYTLPLLFVYNLEVTRYTLPLAPPLAITVASLLTVPRKRIQVSLVALLVFVGVVILGQEGLSQAREFHSTIPPTIAPIQFVKENFNPQTTMVVSTFTYRQFQYYAPDFYNVKGDTVRKIPDIDQYDTVILDYLGIQDQDKKLADFKVSQKLNFAGNPRVFTRLPIVTLYILKKP